MTEQLIDKGDLDEAAGGEPAAIPDGPKNDPVDVDDDAADSEEGGAHA